MITRALFYLVILSLPFFAWIHYCGSDVYRPAVQEAVWNAGLEGPEFYGSAALRCGPSMYTVELTAWRIVDQVPVSAAACCGLRRCEIRDVR